MSDIQQSASSAEQGSSSADHAPNPPSTSEFTPTQAIRASLDRHPLRNLSPEDRAHFGVDDETAENFQFPEGTPSAYGESEGPEDALRLTRAWKDALSRVIDSDFGRQGSPEDYQANIQALIQDAQDIAEPTKQHTSREQGAPGSTAGSEGEAGQSSASDQTEDINDRNEEQNLSSLDRLRERTHEAINSQRVMLLETEHRLAMVSDAISPKLAEEFGINNVREIVADQYQIIDHREKLYDGYIEALQTLEQFLSLEAINQFQAVIDDSNQRITKAIVKVSECSHQLVQRLPKKA